MTKQEAIAQIKQIQRGYSNGFEGFRNFPEELKGNVAKWIEKSDFSERNTFAFGFEYGEIFGLIKAFDIKMEDLCTAR